MTAAPHEDDGKQRKEHDVRHETEQPPADSTNEGSTFCISAPVNALGQSRIVPFWKTGGEPIKSMSMKGVGQKKEEIRPVGWGDDDLLEFLEAVRHQQFATFANNVGGVYGTIREIDACFVKITQNLTHPKNLLGAVLLVRSHAAYRAACGTAMGTQLPETFVLLRSCLEYAGYGLHVNANPQLGETETWVRRHDDAAALKAMKKAFLGVEVEETIVARDKELGRIYKDLYERTIDFGGHPNLRGVISNILFQEESPDKRQLQPIYLHGDENVVAHALKTAAQVGLCSLYLFQHVFEQRFLLLQLRDRLMELRKRL